MLDILKLQIILTSKIGLNQITNLAENEVIFMNSHSLLLSGST